VPVAVGTLETEYGGAADVSTDQFEVDLNFLFPDIEGVEHVDERLGEYYIFFKILHIE
jgi:hypothetical protein